MIIFEIQLYRLLLLCSSSRESRPFSLFFLLFHQIKIKKMKYQNPIVVWASLVLQRADLILLTSISGPMEGGAGPPGTIHLSAAALLLNLLFDIVGISAGNSRDDFVFKKDCTDLVRRISLLTHFFEEMRDFKVDSPPLDVSSSCSSSSRYWYSDLLAALQAAKRLLLTASTFKSANNSVSFSQV